MRCGGRQFSGGVVDEGVHVGQRGGDQFAECRFVGDGQQRHPVGPQQMADLVGDGPPRGGRRQGPLVGADPGHEGVEGVAFCLQIVHDRTGGGHGVSLVRRCAAAADDQVCRESGQVETGAGQRQPR